jgi:hypothetical protein
MTRDIPVVGEAAGENATAEEEDGKRGGVK